MAKDLTQRPTETWIARPRGLLAGFHAETPEPQVPALLHIGEQWAPREWAIPQHEHEVWEFYLQVDGESRWSGPDGLYTLGAGHFLAVAPHVPHALGERPKGKHHFFFAAIDLPAVFGGEDSGLESGWRARDVIFEPQAESLAAPFRQLVREVLLDLPFRAEGVRLSLRSLVMEASRLLARDRAGTPYLIAHPAVAQAKEMLDHQPGELWRLADIAKRVGLSAQHLHERFSAEVGVTPRQYLLDVRMQRAKELLAQSDLPITHIAGEMGFSSSQHFAAVFKRAAGVTPLEYRKTAQRTK